MNEDQLREQIVMHGKSLHERGLTGGSSGNISVRLSDGILITPTNSCMGRIQPENISKLSWDGELLEGEKPSKEAFLHLSVYRKRPEESAIVHLHSTYSVAVSCLTDVDQQNVLPPITAYYVMRVGRLPLIPFFAPGDSRVAQVIEQAAQSSRALLLANHGPLVAGKDLDTAAYAMEEIEETARLFLLLRGQATRFLSDQQCDDLREWYPS